MQIIAFQPELCPALPVVVGNCDYQECHFPQTFPTYFHSLSPPPRADLTFSTKLQDVHHDSSFFF